jgi:molybdopterin converting factor small subunit
MQQDGTVTVEFFGIPRQRAGRQELTVPAGTLGEILAAVERHCPGLAGLRDAAGRLSPHYLLSIDGRAFVDGADNRFAPGQRLLLLSADVGG